MTAQLKRQQNLQIILKIFMQHGHNEANVNALMDSRTSVNCVNAI